MTRPDEQRFTTFPRGAVRDEIILAAFRNALRQRVNPDTGVLFTEDEILYITQPGSRYYIEADAIDLFGQAVQTRAEWLANQTRADRANGDYFDEYHAPLWLPEGKLPATGGVGYVTAGSTAGVVWVGSTTLGDPGAVYGRAPNGKRFQVVQTTTAGINGVTLKLQGIDGGYDTNLTAGTVITWANPPVGGATNGTVDSLFSGGYPQESDSDAASRAVDRIRFKPGSGNSAQFVDWARKADNAVEYAFVYPCALHSGTVVVSYTQKRGSSTLAHARIPNAVLIDKLRDYLTPPSSPVVPERAHVLVVPARAQDVWLSLSLGMEVASEDGWADAVPWPMPYAVDPGVLTAITTVTSQTDITIFSGYDRAGTLSGTDEGTEAPSLMVWDQTTTAFYPLEVLTAVRVNALHWRITLAAPPAITLLLGQVVSPRNGAAKQITEAALSYFDTLGPGEMVVPSDIRFSRASRFPRQEMAYPVRVTSAIAARIDDYLGGVCPLGQLNYTSYATPPVPTADDFTNGPFMLTLGKFAIYSLSL